MVKAKLRLVSLLDENSYLHVEPSEEARIRKILKCLPLFPEWTPISRLAKEIKASTIVTTNTACRLWASRRAEKITNGQTEVLATAPIILLHKEQFSPQRNRKARYLRPAIYFRGGQSYDINN